MEVKDPARAAALKKDWRSAGLTSREQALCAFATKLTLRPGAMTPADLEPLRQVGLDDAAVLDLTQVVAYFNYINRVADGLGVDRSEEHNV